MAGTKRETERPEDDAPDGDTPDQTGAQQGNAAKGASDPPPETTKPETAKPAAKAGPADKLDLHLHLAATVAEAWECARKLLKAGAGGGVQRIETKLRICAEILAGRG